MGEGQNRRAARVRSALIDPCPGSAECAAPDPTAIEITLAGPHDREWLFSLHREAFRGFVERRFGSWCESDQRRRFDQRDPRNLVEIAAVGGHPVGAVHWRVDDDGGLLVELLEVLPAWQERGIGETLLRDLQRRAGPRQHVRIAVRRDNRARGLYERLGFRHERNTATHVQLRWQGTDAADPRQEIRAYPHAVVRELVARLRSTSRPEGMPIAIVAIDGCGGAGKSTLAAQLAEELGGAAVVHTDDFARWDHPLDWWPRLIEEVLEPIKQARPAVFRPFVHFSDETADPVEVPVRDFLVLEGVSASRRAFRPYLATSVWIECPRTLRLQRGLARDGVADVDKWLEWMDAEDEYVSDDNPFGSADVVLSCHRSRYATD